jgi:outer membrane lipoprotein SlyB
MKNRLIIIMLSIASLWLAGCAQNVSPNTYSASDVGKPNKVVSGTVISKRNINIDANSGAGGLAGGVAGAAAGSGVGGSTAGNVVGAVGGAVIGGLLGNAIDKSVNHHQGIEYIVKLKDGSTISLAQVQELQFEVGQHVLVVYGAMTRLIADTTYTTKARS